MTLYQHQLTHWCVKSNVFLVWVKILILLSTELTNIAPSFCRQENTNKPLSLSASRVVIKKKQKKKGRS